MDTKFPSPCGDKLKLRTMAKIAIINLFPSPCGDKLKYESLDC